MSSEAPDSSRRSLYRRAFRHLAPILVPRWTMLLVGVVALLAGAAMELVKPWPVKLLVDYVLGSRSFVPAWAEVPGVSDFTWMVVIVCALILGEALLSSTAAYFKEILMNRLGEEVALELRMALFGHVQRLGLAFHDASRLGDVITTITDDTRSIRDLATSSLLAVGEAVVVILAMLGIMLWMDWKLALVGLVMVPLLAPVIVYFRGRIERASKQRRKRESELTSVTQETMSSIRLVKTLGREDRQQGEFSRESAKSAEIGVEVARLEAGYVRAVDFLAALGICAVVAWGVHRVRAGGLTPGDLIVFVTYVKRLYSPIRDLAKESAKISKGRAGLERVTELLEQVPSVADAPGARPAPALAGRIEFEDVSFGYGSARAVLEQVSFACEPGQVIALVGHSGAGKSTILSLLSRLYDPSGGRVLLDGHDLREYTLASLRDQISVVLQDSVLLQTSIHENILYGRADATRAEVETAAADAGVAQFVTRLANGYDTVVGQRGATLSGGERQRVSIARAIVRRAPILLLDEPTTGLDATNELAVMQALGRLMKGKTTLLISHRLNLIQRADRIFVLDGGRIVEQGTDAELVARAGVYARLRAAADRNGGEIADAPALRELDVPRRGEAEARR